MPLHRAPQHAIATPLQSDTSSVLEQLCPAAAAAAAFRCRTDTTDHDTHQQYQRLPAAG